MVKVIK